ncbi:hypothetical protein R6Q59_002424 [Mikania micrantha]|uniref:Inositol-tetrakisphosphate 1-kinase n=1 Tax=Mikania micrantha TaxID=192012 RepID=A0A5N6NR12_9ASTR|nr:hypothetical protein E3N88_19464 [Mikania micrantha]
MPEITSENRHFRVGYALPATKTEAFMVESFITYAKKRGIEFIPIIPSKPLIEQGPFDCIIHKLYGDQWNLNLQTFTTGHPNATVIDPPSAINRLHNRITMLEPVTRLNIPKLSIPTQLLVDQVSETVKYLGVTKDLMFPVIAKPLLADGTNNAHDISLVVNHEGLTKVLARDPPMVLQQFVNHGGTMFKVYVAGEYAECVKRSSLPDVSNETIEKMTSESGGVMIFSKISSSVINGDDGWSDNGSGEKVKMPSLEFVDEVAKGLRQALGLHLFNFDMIRDDKRDGYLIVDINYFPGYEKLPFFESVMTDFFIKIKKSQELKKMMEENIEVDNLET